MIIRQNYFIGSEKNPDDIGLGVCLVVDMVELGDLGNNFAIGLLKLLLFVLGFWVCMYTYFAM